MIIRICTIYRIVIFFFALFVFTDYATGEDNQKKPGLVTLERGAIYEFLATGDKGEVRVPISLHKDVEASKLILNLIDARIGQRSDPMLMDAFQASIQDTSDSQGAAIQIAVNLGPNMQDGTYDLLWKLNHKESGESQLINLQIIHPAAKIRPPGTLVVDRIIRVFIDPIVQHGPLILRETSGRSHLTHLFVEQVEANTEDEKPVSGQIIFKNLSTIKPSRSGKADYQLKGSFPLGTVTGTLEIDAPQLSDKVEVPFKVRSKLHWWTIFFFIGLGLLVGSLLRNHLQARVQLGEARLQAIQLLNRIRRELQQHPDEDFRQAVQEAEEKLKNVLNQKKPAEITEKITVADEALNIALTKFQERRNTCGNQLDELMQAVRTEYLLPRNFQQYRTEACKQLEDVQKTLNQNRINQAQTECEGIREKQTTHLVTVMTEWRKCMKDLFNRLEKSTSPLFVRARMALDNPHKEAKKAVNDIPIQDPKVTLENLLKSSHDALFYSDEFAAGLLSNMQVILTQEILQPLTISDIPNREPVKELKQKFEDLMEKTSDKTGEPEVIINLLLEQDAELTESLKNAILEQIKDTKQREDIEELLKGANFQQAVASAINASKKKDLEEGVPLGETGSETIFPEIDVSAVMFPLVPPRPRQPTKPVVLKGSVREDRPSPRLQALDARTTWELWAAKFWQNLLTGILIAVVGFLLFEENFVGTAKDIAMVFFWAFGIDISVDVIIESAKGIKRS